MVAAVTVATGTLELALTVIDAIVGSKPVESKVQAIRRIVFFIASIPYIVKPPKAAFAPRQLRFLFVFRS